MQLKKEWVGHYETMELFPECKEMHMLSAYFCNKEDQKDKPETNEIGYP